MIKKRNFYEYFLTEYVVWIELWYRIGSTKTEILKFYAGYSGGDKQGCVPPSLESIRGVDIYFSRLLSLNIFHTNILSFERSDGQNQWRVPLLLWYTEFNVRQNCHN